MNAMTRAGAFLAMALAGVGTAQEPAAVFEKGMLAVFHGQAKAVFDEPDQSKTLDDGQIEKLKKATTDFKASWKPA